ncbi:MAG TPA: MarR family transcriptional regulator [Armatimonadetes bacterium]|jgi:DNA-binding MarR family transcriptional regulator|nr:MarR family transcriptional regulator [Armatimonadota bacterium]
MAASRDELMIAIDDLIRSFFGPPLRRRPVDLELTLGQLECLRLIGILDSPSMSELSTELQLSPSTVTGLVDALVQRGKVERVADPDDRRVVRARLTAKGRREWEQHRERRRRHLLDLLGELRDDDLCKLHEGLGALYAAALRRVAQKESEGEPDA